MPTSLETEQINRIEDQPDKRPGLEHTEAEVGEQELTMASELERKSPEGYFGKVSNMAGSAWEKIKHTPGINFGAGMARGIYDDIEGTLHLANTARKAAGLTFGEGSHKRAQESRQELKAMGKAIGHMVRHPVDTLSALTSERAKSYADSYNNEAGTSLGYEAGRDFYSVASMFVGVGEVRAAAEGLKVGSAVSKEASVAAKIAGGAEKITEAAGREAVVAGKVERLVVKDAAEIALKTEQKGSKILRESEQLAVKEAEVNTHFFEKITNPDTLSSIEENSNKFQKDLKAFQTRLEEANKNGGLHAMSDKLTHDFFIKLKGELMFGPHHTGMVPEARALEKVKKTAAKRADENLQVELGKYTEDSYKKIAEHKNLSVEDVKQEIYQQLKKDVWQKTNDSIYSNMSGNYNASLYSIGIKDSDIEAFVAMENELKRKLGLNYPGDSKGDFEYARYRAYYEARRTGRNVFSHVTSGRKAEQIIHNHGLKSSKITTPAEMTNDYYALKASGQTANLEENIYFTSGGGGFDYGGGMDMKAGEKLKRESSDFAIFTATGNDILSSGKSIEVATPTMVEKGESLRGRAVGAYEAVNGTELPLDNLHLVVPESELQRYNELFVKSGYDEKFAREHLIGIPNSIIEAALKEGEGAFLRDSKILHEYFNTKIKQEVLNRSKNQDKIFATTAGRKSADAVSQGTDNQIFEWKQINLGSKKAEVGEMGLIAEKKRSELEKTFSKLGIDAETQTKILVEAPEQRRNLLERSFGNIRESVKAFIEEYSEIGVVDRKAFNADRISVANRVYVEAAPQLIKKLDEVKAKYGLEVDLDELLRSEAVWSPGEQIGKIEEQLSHAIDRHIAKEVEDAFSSKGSYQGIERLSETDLQDYGKASKYGDALYRAKSQRQQEIMPRAELEEFRDAFFKKFHYQEPHPNDYVSRFTPPELLERVASEAERLKTDFRIHINMSVGNLLKALQQGELKTARQLGPEEIKKLRNLQGRNLSDEYFKRRRRLEREIELPEDQPIVYGTYADPKGPEGRTGGAASYGDVFVEVKPKDKFSITEGDSYNLNDSPVGQRKRQNISSPRTKIEGEYNDIIFRQLQMEHAHIAKAIYNIEANLSEAYGGGGVMTYIETQMPSVTLDDIEKINIPARHIEKFQQLLKQQVPDFEKWLSKINIIEQ